MGELPSSKYREGMSQEDLKAWLELYPDAAITISQLKKCISEYTYGEKTSGTKPQLLNRLRKFNFYSWPDNLKNDHTKVECWADEAPALQAKFDQLKEVWLSELKSDKENATNFETSKKQKGAVQDNAVKQRKDEETRKLKLKQKQYASSRRCVARPYIPKLKSRAVGHRKECRRSKLDYVFRSHPVISVR
jgi:hypothetical protein